MRTPLHTRLFCCWLAILVLLSSTGFGMVEHWCQMRGHTKTLLAAQKECPKPCQADEPEAPVSGGPVLKKQPCCKTTLTYEHLDVSSFVADYHPLPTPSPAAFLPNPQFQFLLAALFPPASAQHILPTADTPLHRTGRFRLTSLCTWLI
ncbi:hypothetical protein GGR92_005316 [Spirosoma lacussanchae]|uniref:HYC_CC_PP family protein n=1 Tax=Spirosoma lacussanchae TaxID=1884249 RepID=UPI003D1D2C26